MRSASDDQSSGKSSDRAATRPRSTTPWAMLREIILFLYAARPLPPDRPADPPGLAPDVRLDPDVVEIHRPEPGQRHPHTDLAVRRHLAVHVEVLPVRLGGLPDRVR